MEHVDADQFSVGIEECERLSKSLGKDRKGKRERETMRERAGGSSV